MTGQQTAKRRSVLMIGTGGTIASETTASGLAPVSNLSVQPPSLAY